MKCYSIFKAVFVVVAGMTGLLNSAHAEPIYSYVAKLGPADHFSSKGKRLRSAAAIIRQDRANFHIFGKADAQDQWDSFFSSKANRARLERMLNNGTSSRATRNRIVNGQPSIRVDIYSDSINVTVF